MLSGLNRHGGVDPQELYPIFFREFTSVLAPRLSVVLCCVDVPISKGAMSFLLPEFKTILIKPVLSNVFLSVWSPLACVLLWRTRVSSASMPIVKDWELVMPCWTYFMLDKQPWTV